MTLSQFDELYIDGEFIAPVEGGRIESVDPATGEIWATVAAAGAADIDRAVVAADRAFRDPEWRGLTAAQRGQLLARLADLLERDLDELAAIESRDNGKPISNARMDVANAAVWFRYYAGAADKVSGEQLPISETIYAYTVRVPLGVVAAIIPWNSPLPIMSWKLAPALAAGNTVVLKPSELAGASCLKAAALFTEAGFPAGVVNILPGHGDPAGVALISHPLVAKISFTGSDRTGQAVGEVAARRFVPITAECGGRRRSWCSPTLTSTRPSRRPSPGCSSTRDSSAPSPRASSCSRTGMRSSWQRTSLGSPRSGWAIPRTPRPRSARSSPPVSWKESRDSSSWHMTKVSRSCWGETR